MAYLPPVLTEEVDSSPEWTGYRTRRSAFFIAIPVCGLLAILLGTFFHPPEILFGILFLPVFIAGTALQFFKCPRCGESFFYRMTWRPGALECVHCGLPKWKPGSYQDDLEGKPPAMDGFYPTPRETSSPPDPAIAARARLASFLTLVLRDDPGSLGLSPDPRGWVDAGRLLHRANKAGVPITRGSLDDFVASPDGSNFELESADGRIRYRDRFDTPTGKISPTRLFHSNET